MSVFNASGSVEFPGFHDPTQANPPGNWTLSLALRNIQNFSTNTTYLENSLWLDTHPQEKLSSPRLPYIGCTVILAGAKEGLATEQIPRGVNGYNSCDSVMPKECQESILSNMRVGAGRQAGQYSGDEDDLCDFMDVIGDGTIDLPTGCPVYTWQQSQALGGKLLDQVGDRD